MQSENVQIEEFSQNSVKNDKEYTKECDEEAIKAIEQLIELKKIR